MSDEADPVLQAAWYVDAGYPREALNALRDASPTDLRAVYVRAQALGNLGRFTEAADEACRGLALEPESVELLELLASVQMNDDAAAAEVTLRKAIALSPDNARLLALYVLILLEQGRYEWAEKMLDRAMRIAPDDETTRRVRVMFMARAAGSNEGRAAVRELLREYPDEAFAHYMQGLTLLGSRWWRGLWHLRQAAAMSPQDVLITETARVMRSWYLWPVHLTSGVVHWVIAASYFAALIWTTVRGGPIGQLLLAYFCFFGYKWGAYLLANALIRRRVTRALRER